MRLDGSSFLATAHLASDIAATIGAMFPDGLTSLSLLLADCQPSPISVPQLVIDAVSLQHQLTTLTLNFVDADEGVDSSPLQRVPLLSSLELGSCSLVDQSMRALSQLSSLESLVILSASWTPSLLVALADPERCKLQCLRFLQIQGCVISAAGMACFARLPALDRLTAWRFDPSALELLPSIKSLTAVRICMPGTYIVNFTPVASVLPMANLRACRLLTDIRFDCFSFTESDLQSLVNDLPLMGDALSMGQTSPLPPSPPLLAVLSPVRNLRELSILHCRSFSPSPFPPWLE